MKIVIKKPGEYPEVKEIRDDEDGAVEDLQDIVGGYIQLVYPFGKYDRLVLVVDEDGKCKDDYKENIVLPDSTGRVVDFCVGTVAVAGLVYNEQKELVLGSVDKRVIPWVKNWLDVRQIQEG